MFSTDDVGSSLSQFYQDVEPEAFEAISNVRQISGGWEAFLFAFRLQLKSGESQEYILRLFPNDGDGKAQHEFNGMQRLKRLHYPVPTVYHLHLSHQSIFKNAFFIMDFVEGGTVYSQLISDGVLNEKLLAAYCQIMVDLHQLEWESEFDADFDADDPYAFIDHWLHQADSMLQHEVYSDFVPLVEWVKARRDLLACPRLSLTHNDFHPENVMIDGDGKLYVIDWSNWRLADYRYDLGWTLLLVGTYGSREYSSALLSLYESLQGNTAEQMNIFIAMAIGRRLRDLVSSTKGSPSDSGMLPDIAEVMRQNVSHYRACYDWLLEITNTRLLGIENLLAELD